MTEQTPTPDPWKDIARRSTREIVLDANGETRTDGIIVGKRAFGWNPSWMNAAEVDAARAADQQRIADLQRWKDAVTDALVVDWCLNEDTANDPRRAIAALIEWNIKIHDDPTVSKVAADREARIADLSAQNGRLTLQARDISLMLSESGCGAMPIVDGVRWLIDYDHRLRAEQADWKADVTRLNLHVECVQDEADNLRAKLSTAEATIQQQANELADLEATIDRNDAHTVGLLAQLDAAEATIASLRADVERLTRDTAYVADVLARAARLGSDRDVPEGVRYIQISDTLARQMESTIRRSIDAALPPRGTP